MYYGNKIISTLTSEELALTEKVTRKIFEVLQEGQSEEKTRRIKKITIE